MCTCWSGVRVRVKNVETVLCVDDDYSMYDEMDLEKEVSPSNVGYLINTSGTLWI